MNNNDIRFYAKGCGVPFWKIAEKLGISENTFTRIMRKEVSPEKKSEILSIIDQIKNER